jgi:hypothetical protein
MSDIQQNVDGATSNMKDIQYTVALPTAPSGGPTLNTGDSGYGAAPRPGNPDRGRDRRCGNCRLQGREGPYSAASSDQVSRKRGY